MDDKELERLLKAATDLSIGLAPKILDNIVKPIADAWGEIARQHDVDTANRFLQETTADGIRWLREQAEAWAKALKGERPK